MEKDKQVIIHVWLCGDTWLARFENSEVMGNIAVHTAFSSKINGAVVAERMLACNPGADVRVSL